MHKLGNIFVNRPVTVTIGALYYIAKSHQALVGLDVAALVPILRDAESEVVSAACLPKHDEEAPFIDNLDLHTTDHKKIGYLYSDSDHRGKIYQVRLDVATTLKRFDIVWCHLHDPHKEE